MKASCETLVYVRLRAIYLQVAGVILKINVCVAVSLISREFLEAS